MDKVFSTKGFKAAAIIMLCVIAVIASIYTQGLTRAIIELTAFTALIWLVLAKPHIQSEE
ncbi:hypothetical protein [Shewanella maritima]|uniref:hypothetical protein n=1 Tax=Shewanella maritima TaxID=2520507 RepID=UPI003736031E